MPASTIERTRLPREMRDALKRHVLRERQRKKEEADANEADKQRRRAEKAKALSSSQVQLEDNAKDIVELERQLVELEQQKSEQCNLLKRALTEEDHRKHSQQTVTKGPSWTSLYPPNLQMAQYPPHHQHYLSTQQSHRLLAYKPPPQLPQPPSFIPTTSSTNLVPKRARSPSSHIYSSPSNKSSRSNLAPQMHTRAPSPGSAYSSSTAQQMARSAGAFAPAQNPSAFSAYHGYIPSNSAAANQSVSYPNAMPRVRGPGQMSNYLNPLSFLPQPIGDSKQQQQQQAQQSSASAYSHHPMLIPTKNGSITNGYPIQPQQ